MAATNQERLAKMEAQMANVKDDLVEIKSDIKEIKMALESNFVTHIEFQNYKSSQVIIKILIAMLNLFFGTLLGYAISQLLT